MQFPPDSITDYLIIVLFLIISFGISFLVYRKTQLKKSLKILAGLSRFFAVFLVLVLLLNPLIKILKYENKNSVNLFLFDLSESTELTKSEDYSKIYEKLKEINSDENKPRYFAFGNDIMFEIKRDDDFYDSTKKAISDKSFSTNIVGSIESAVKLLSPSVISNVIIISDGLTNTKTFDLSRLFNTKFPVYYYFNGDTNIKKDASILNLSFNRTTFTGSINTIKADIKSYGLNKILKIRLYEDGYLISEKELPVNDTRKDYSINFNVSSSFPGIKKYKVDIVPDDEELTIKNNSDQCYIKFKDDKINILVISGSPSADYSFFKDIISRNRNFRVNFITQKSQDLYYEPESTEILNNKSFSLFDAVILFGYPTEKTISSEANKIYDLIEKSGNPLIFFDASNTDYTKLKIFSSSLPFRIESTNRSERDISPIPLINKPEYSSFYNELKFALPEIKSSGIEIIPKSDAVSLLIDSRSSKPVFIIQNSNINKSSAFLGYNTNKIRFLGEALTESYRLIINSSVTSVYDRNKSGMFSLETNKQNYYPGEKFVIRGYNKAGFQGDSSSAVISISEKDTAIKLNLEKINNKYFEKEFSIKDTGEFIIKGNLNINNRTEYTDSIKINIGRTNTTEYKNLISDPGFLIRIAKETGGRDINSLTREESDSLLSITKSPDEKGYTDYFEMRKSSIILSIIIFLFSAEWFIRKKSGLI